MSIDDFLLNYRAKIELVWDDETISPKFLPIDISKPRSLGQCASTSVVLMHELREKYPGKSFILAIGQVRHGESIIIPYHVWVVEVADGSPRQNKVIDVTADQSGVLSPVVYDSYERLTSAGTLYIAYEMSATARFIHQEAQGRVAVLTKRYEEKP